jgi:hypothetical protein
MCKYCNNFFKNIHQCRIGIYPKMMYKISKIRSKINSLNKRKSPQTSPNINKKEEKEKEKEEEKKKNIEVNTKNSIIAQDIHIKNYTLDIEHVKISQIKQCQEQDRQSIKKALNTQILKSDDLQLQISSELKKVSDFDWYTIDSDDDYLNIENLTII